MVALGARDPLQVGLDQHTGICAVFKPIMMKKTAVGARLQSRPLPA